MVFIGNVTTGKVHPEIFSIQLKELNILEIFSLGSLKALDSKLLLIDGNILLLSPLLIQHLAISPSYSAAQLREALFTRGYLLTLCNIGVCVNPKVIYKKILHVFLNV